MAPSILLLIGVGLVVTVAIGIGGFVLGVRTALSDRGLAVVVGGATILALLGVFEFPEARAVVIVGAIGALFLIPIYALFWILHDFVETTVRS